MESVDALWLGTLQTLCGIAAHELRGALNGVALNVEVVRSRLEHTDRPIAALKPFAEAAGSQLIVLTEMTEAVLALARASGEPADVGAVLRQFVTLFEPVVRHDGRVLRLESASAAIASTVAPPSAVRLVLGMAFLSVVNAAAVVTCRLRPGPPLTVDIRPAPPELELSHGILEALGNAGITVTMDGHGISIMFPTTASHGSNSYEAE